MSNRRKSLAVAATSGGVLLLAAVAAAGAPTDTTYYACLKNGRLSEVGTSAPSCAANETGISWSQRGPVGPAGPQGPIGLTGATGAQGPTGETGATGATGEPGATGPAGPQGEQGVQGVPGEKGDPGAIGPVGPQGPPGLDAQGAAALACDTLAADQRTTPDTSVDVFLTLAGIPGDSVDSKHKGAIEVSSFCLGGASADDDGVFTVEKPLDSASVPILEALADGTSIATAQVDVVRASKLQETVATFKFSNISVRGYRLGGHETLDEDVSFRWTQVVAQTGGTAGEPITAPDPVAETEPRCAALTTDREPGDLSGVSAFLEIPSIPGGSQSDKHKGAIEVRSICFGGSRAGGSGPSYTSVTTTKRTDVASARLHNAFREGTVLADSTIAVERVTDKGYAPVLRLELASPTVAGYRAGARGGPLAEDLALTTGSLTVTYFVYDPAGRQTGTDEVILDR